MGTEFPWRWGRGTISANLDVIWGMSDRFRASSHLVVGVAYAWNDPWHGGRRPTAGWRSLAHWHCGEKQVSIHSDPPWAFLAAKMPVLALVENSQLPLAFPWILECIATPQVSQVSLLLMTNLEMEFAAHHFNHRPIRKKDSTPTYLAGMPQ